MDQEMKRHEISRLKQTKNYSQCQKSIAALISLLKNNRLWAEYSLMERMAPKIAIRLRNSPYSRSLEQLCKVANEFKTAVKPRSPFDEMKTFFESELLESNIEAVQLSRRIEDFLNRMQFLAERLFKIAILSQKAFNLAQLWLDLGQLVNHFLMISCVTSRICVFSKALLVYLYDVYQMTRKLQRVYYLDDEFNMSSEEDDQDPVKSYLLKLKIKLRPNLSKESQPSSRKHSIQKSQTLDASLIETDVTAEGKELDLGVRLDRDSFNNVANIVGGISAVQARKRQQKREKRKQGGFKDNSATLISTSNSKEETASINDRSSSNKKVNEKRRKQKKVTCQVGKPPKPVNKQTASKKKNKRKSINKS